ncbi:MAG: tetratricopeptide repeat protein, partial [Lentisphaeria bacterium]|nr:tetratricopeptide repeat protein [Lentisphaeria bacterium]
KLKPLADHFRTFGRKYSAQIVYFEALYDFCQGPEGSADLAKRMQDLGAEIQTDLSNLIHLQLALNNDNVEKVRSSLETIMWRPPFYDLQERARTSVRRYLWSKIEEEPALADDSRMARLAQLVSTPDVKDSFLMRLILSDLNRRNVVTRQIIEDDLSDFPDDPYLLRIAAEFELFNGNPELCLEYTERYYTLKDAERSTTFDLLHMLAQELAGNIDEATREFTALVDNSEMDRALLFRYFRFCIQHERRTELEKMAERLDVSSVPDLKALAPFFLAEAMFLDGKPDEAIALLETTATESQDFALHAADMFRAHGRLDRALSGYRALLDTYSDRGLILSDIAEVYLDMGMKPEAVSYAERAWEMDMDDAHAQYVYAKILAASGRYQEAERVLRIPYREVELPPEIEALWTDIMTHCVQEDFANRLFLRALDRANHYLIIYPGDYMFREFKDRAEEAFREEEAWRLWEG